jgi:hypothetical protein
MKFSFDNLPPQPKVDETMAVTFLEEFDRWFANTTFTGQERIRIDEARAEFSLRPKEWLLDHITETLRHNIATMTDEERLAISGAALALKEMLKTDNPLVDGDTFTFG